MPKRPPVPTSAAAVRRWLLDQQGEAQFQDAVRTWAKAGGWLDYAAWSSQHSPAGWPDLALASVTRGWLVFAELKSAKGRLSPAQVRWLSALAAVSAGWARCGVCVWRPAMADEVADFLLGRAQTPPGQFLSLEDSSESL